MNRRLTAVIQREGDGVVALCVEIDVASQGDTIEAPRENLCEAVELFFECASPEEIQQRQSGVPRSEFGGRVSPNKAIISIRKGLRSLGRSGTRCLTYPTAGTPSV